ncbi:MAG: DUF1552 domain-containing protein [Verrucomicrobiales bacterium]|nr:DUF1552 domain-containing protein [Verrucomicrobiales bacterium]
MKIYRPDRRTFLRGTGVSLALPWLQCLNPGTARAAGNPGDVRRMLAMNSPLGIHTPLLFPEKTGRDYEVTPYLQPLQEVREHFTVISGLMHPMVDGGHAAEKSFLTGAAHPGHSSFRNSISLDQYAAEQIGHETRFPYLSLSVSGNSSLSWTRSGVQIPADSSPSKVFARLFLDGSATEKAKRMEQIKDGQSIMDLVGQQSRELARKTGREDSETLDQYFTSVREVEKRMAQSEIWEKSPKPKVDLKQPEDIKDSAEFTARMEMIYDLIYLAFQTDSTRLITVSSAGGNSVVNLKGVDDGWHNLSHHGKDPAKIEQLAIIEREEMRLLGTLLKRLHSTPEGGSTLLDQTAVIFGSSLGNASSHNNSNLPIIAAGGKFKHGQHLAFDPQDPPPLCNLYVSYLQHLGLETDKFSSGAGTLTGLELA